MLPGTVREVHQGKKGYGNFVLLDYGNMQCLYGHLSHITVKQNEIVEVGTIIGTSGSGGKSIRYLQDGTLPDPRLDMDLKG